MQLNCHVRLRNSGAMALMGYVQDQRLWFEIPLCHAFPVVFLRLYVRLHI